MYVAVKRILRYLQGSLQKGLFYSSNSALGNVVCVNAFCDADWAGEVIQNRSTIGFVCILACVLYLGRPRSKVMCLEVPPNMNTRT